MNTPTELQQALSLVNSAVDALIESGWTPDAAREQTALAIQVRMLAVITVIADSLQEIAVQGRE